MSERWRAGSGRALPLARAGSSRPPARGGTGLDRLGPAHGRLGRLHPANGGVGRLHPARRLDRVEAAAVAGDDAVELGQRLDLVDDDAPHVGGGLGRLLRQLENALAQLGARALELLLHLGGHLLQTRRASRRTVAPPARASHATPRRPARRCCAWPRPAVGVLLRRRLRISVEILGDRLHAAGGGVGGEAGDVARPFRRAFERLVEHVGKAGQPLVQLVPLPSSVATSSSSEALRSASSPSVRRLLLSISATASASERPCVSNWPASCDRSLSVSSDIDLKLAMLRSTSLLAEPAFCATSFMAATKSDTRATSVLSISLMFSCAPLSTSWSRMLASRSRS